MQKKKSPRWGARRAATAEILATLDACDEAVAWARSHPSPARAWAACERPDWLFWFATRAGVDRRLVVRAACEIVSSVLYLALDDDLRAAEAVATALAWSTMSDVDRPTVDDLYAAARAAYLAASVADEAADEAAAAAYLARAAAAEAAEAAADEAAEAAYLARAAANVAHDGDAFRRWSCDVIRDFIPYSMVMDLARAATAEGAK